MFWPDRRTLQDGLLPLLRLGVGNPADPGS
jgi:hypothetical protein